MLSSSLLAVLVGVFFGVQVVFRPVLAATTTPDTTSTTPSTTTFISTTTTLTTTPSTPITTGTTHTVHVSNTTPAPQQNINYLYVCEFHVSMPAEWGSIVGSLSDITDADFVRARDWALYIDPGLKPSPFGIKTDGTVYVSLPTLLVPHTADVYNMSVQGCFRTTPSRCTVLHMKIFAHNNKKPPYFPTRSSHPPIQLLDGMKEQTTVGSIPAEDMDTRQHDLLYIITNEEAAKYLTIKQFGMITTKIHIRIDEIRKDFDITAGSVVFGMVVEVNDGDFNASVIVPVFVDYASTGGHEVMEHALDINYNVPIGSTILTIYSNRNENRQLDPSIVKLELVNEKDTFYIDEATDELKTHVELSMTKYLLRVYVYELGVCLPIMEHRITLNVQVNATNAFTPQFDRDVYTFLYLINGSEIIVEDVLMRIIDEDGTGENGNITLRLIYFRQQICEHCITSRQHVGNITDFQVNGHELRSEALRLGFSLAEGLTVVAEDKGNPALSTTAAVRFLSKNGDDIPFPILGNFTDNVLEHTSGGLPIIRSYLPGLNPIHYYLMKTSQLFRINTTTGQLLLNGELDCEAQQIHSVTVIAANSAFPQSKSLQTVTINVHDINDFQAQFLQEIYYADVSEDVEPGHVIMSIAAVDFDCTSFGRVALSYSITEDILPFNITNDGSMILTEPLDYEVYDQRYWRENIFKLSVVVSEPAGNVIDNCTVYIRITDVEDNPPTLPVSEYATTIDESTPPGSVISVFRSSDNDAHNTYREIRCSLDSNITENLDYFSVGTNGRACSLALSNTTIRDARKKKREVNAGISIALLLTVHQGAYSISLTISIHVVTPSDLFRFSQPTYDIQQFEGELVNRQLALEDLSSIPADQPSFRIDGVGGSINVDNTGRLYNTKVLDRETDGEIVTVVVVAELPDEIARAVVYITLADVNDNSPRCRSQVFKFSIKEGQEDVVVGIIQVEDDDADAINRQVTYTIQATDLDQIFSISDDGEIHTLVELDREIAYHYDFKVLVRNVASPYHSTTCTVEVSVLDVNDNDPVIDPQAELLIHENTPIDAVVRVVHAVDGDMNYETLHFRLNSTAPYLDIHEELGEIRVEQLLDFETLRSFDIDIFVMDSTPPQRTSSVRIHVVVIDDNDHGPIFDDNTYIVPFVHTFLVGDVLTTVHAQDQDSGINREITYTTQS